ncbi:MAG: hypothetical protein JST40_09820 [Armatimonadetes bacterium]|nr:hypothetical protein [Armatimonadota bacterium]
MAGRESYFWHKLHSLSGIVPVGFYMVQHLTLNSFALAGPKAYNGVINFFEGMPKHFLIVLKYGVVWLPLLFHAIYGLFIASRMEAYVSPAAKKYRENGYYLWQRWSGIFAFVFLCYHMASTSIANARFGPDTTVYYENWASYLSGTGYVFLIVYVLGILACAYHLAYGIWMFCIRWGITISEESQQRMARFSKAAFFFLTLLGWLALVGFFYSPLAPKDTVASTSPPVETPQSSVPGTTEL